MGTEMRWFREGYIGVLLWTRHEMLRRHKRQEISLSVGLLDQFRSSEIIRSPQSVSVPADKSSQSFMCLWFVYVFPYVENGTFIETI
jgi:hypothetical protein